MNSNDDDVRLVYAYEHDNRYESLTPVELRVMRDKMYAARQKGERISKYDFSCVQYHLMKKENRLPPLK